jgi:hypothetical protein
MPSTLTLGVKDGKQVKKIERISDFCELFEILWRRIEFVVG